MKVADLRLRRFRNARELQIKPSSQLNFFLGSNGRGKTSVLEALGFVASLRSFRGSKTPEVILWNHSDAEVQAVLTPDDAFQDSEFKTEVKVAFWQDAVTGRSTKTAFINGKAYRNSTAFLSQRFGQFELGVHAIVFNPSDHDLVRGEPAERRNFLDRACSAESLEYMEWITRYAKVIDQRNALLKDEQRPTPEELQGFTTPLVELGARITRARLDWLCRAAPSLAENAAKIAPSQARLRQIYFSNWVPETNGLSFSNKGLNAIHFTGQSPPPPLQDLENAFSSRLRELEMAEWRAGSTLVGPHRDDWGFFYGDHVLKGHGSQGEVRTALLALKLTELRLFQEATGHRPLFLLDDFSSELDRERRLFLLRFLSESGLQVFVTSTEEPPGAKELGRCFWLEERKSDGDATSEFDPTAAFGRLHAAPKELDGRF